MAAGCDVVTVQRALGYASATTTLNTYGRWPTADGRGRTRKAAEGLVLGTVAIAPADCADFSPAIGY